MSYVCTWHLFARKGRILETCFGASAADASSARGAEYGPWMALRVWGGGGGLGGAGVQRSFLNGE